MAGQINVFAVPCYICVCVLRVSHQILPDVYESWWCSHIKWVCACDRFTTVTFCKLAHNTAKVDKCIALVHLGFRWLVQETNFFFTQVRWWSTIIFASLLSDAHDDWMILNNNEIYYSKPDHINTHTCECEVPKEDRWKARFWNEKKLIKHLPIFIIYKTKLFNNITHTHTQINGKEPAHYFELIDMLKIQMFSFWFLFIIIIIVQFDSIHKYIHSFIHSFTPINMFACMWQGT